MFHITSSLFGGLAAITAWALVAPSFDPAAQIGATSAGHETVNRALKSDRLLLPPSHAQSERKVATVEVIGVHDAAIVYRDRDGNVLFQTDPVSNVTVVAKGFVVPQLTLRDTPQSKPAPMVETPRDLDAAPKLLIGCEPPASPIAEPALARLPGRCLS
jgi:hypothetical protein